MNTDKCKECNSTSLEKCLKIQCPYFMNIKRDKNENKDTEEVHWVKSIDDDMIFEGDGNGIITVKIGSFQRIVNKDDIKELRDLLDEILNLE